jgi:glycosyl transferase family 25
MSDLLPPVFVINRPKDFQRRSDMEERLGRLGIKAVFFDAVDGYSLNIDTLPEYDGEKRRRYFGKDLGAGEIGCLLSHRALYQKMVSENIERAIILEDDVFLDSEFRAVLEDICNAPIDWEVIRFVGHGKVFNIGFRQLFPLNNGYWITRVPTSPSGAYAYMLTRKAAETFLQFMQRNWIPVDIIHSRAWETRLETLLIQPSPVTPDLVSPSTIGEVRFERAQAIQGLTKFLHPLYRFWYKLSNGVGKRLLYLMNIIKDKQNQRRYKSTHR